MRVGSPVKNFRIRVSSDHTPLCLFMETIVFHQRSALINQVTKLFYRGVSFQFPLPLGSMFPIPNFLFALLFDAKRIIFIP